jgi:membrane protease subunit HflK
MGGYSNIPEIKIPKISPRMVILAIVGILILFAASTVFYTVAPDEVAVIQRFGKFIGTEDQGLHFKFPFGIDKVTTVKTTFVYKQEFGFRTASAGVQSEFITEGIQLDNEKLVLCGDLNVLGVEWVMQFTISDPYKYLFKIRNAEGTLRAVSEAAVKEVIGDHSVDEVITTEREEIGAKAKLKVQAILDSYEAGINITDVRLRNVNPPTREVQDAFEAVNRAEQKRQELIEQANAERNRVVPRERGLAEQRIAQALGYKEERVSVAEGEATKFNTMLAEYSKAKSVTKKRLYLETLSQVIPKLGKVLIMDDTMKGLVPLLNFQESLLQGGAK